MCSGLDTLSHKFNLHHYVGFFTLMIRNTPAATLPSSAAARRSFPASNFDVTPSRSWPPVKCHLTSSSDGMSSKVKNLNIDADKFSNPTLVGVQVPKLRFFT